MKTRKILLLLVVIGIFGLFAGCEKKAKVEQTLTILSTNGLDGYVEEGNSARTDITIHVGDWYTNSGMRGFLSFDISNIPATAEIVQAVLRVYQVNYSNGSPYTKLGDLIVDHVNIGTILEVTDYDGGTLQSNLGTLSTNLTFEYKELEVTDALNDDLGAARNTSQFRLRFSVNTDSNGISDYTTFEGRNNYYNSNNPPQLVVIYK